MGMKQWLQVVSLATLGVAIAFLSGCGSDSPGSSESGLSGRWRGIIAAGLMGTDIQVDADLKSSLNAKDILSGTLTMNVPRCFNSAQATAILSKTSVMLFGTGGGTVTQYSSAEITGELAAENNIVGLFSMASMADECDVDATAITLRRK